MGGKEQGVDIGMLLINGVMVVVVWGYHGSDIPMAVIYFGFHARDGNKVFGFRLS